MRASQKHVVAHVDVVEASLDVSGQDVRWALDKHTFGHQGVDEAADARHIRRRRQPDAFVDVPRDQRADAVCGVELRDQGACRRRP